MLPAYLRRASASSSSNLAVFSVTLGGRTISAVSTLCAVKLSTGAARGGDSSWPRAGATSRAGVAWVVCGCEASLFARAALFSAKETP